MSKPQLKHTVFTKGEKCIFFHIVVTFSLILVLLFMLFVHLCLVKHSAYDVLKVYRRSAECDNEAVPGGAPNYLTRVGAVFLAQPSRILCHALLLRAEWSLVPGHCAAARSDPDLAEHLPHWRVRYAGVDNVDTAVRRSVPHPQFDSELFANNVGVLQHEVAISIEDFVYPQAVEQSFVDHLELVGWEWNKHSHSDEGRLKKVFVYPMPNEECQHFVSSITEVRSPYEFCVTAMEGHLCFEHGALVYSRNTVVGFFSWGERCGKTAVPLIIVNIKMYQGWLEEITSMKT